MLGVCVCVGGGVCYFNNRHFSPKSLALNQCKMYYCSAAKIGADSVDRVGTQQKQTVMMWNIFYSISLFAQIFFFLFSICSVADHKLFFLAAVAVAVIVTPCDMSGRRVKEPKWIFANTGDWLECAAMHQIKFQCIYYQLLRSPFLASVSLLSV